MINYIFKKTLLISLVFVISSCSLFIVKTVKKTPPNYGNYCIFEHSIKNFKLIPIDKTDLAFKNFHKCKRELKSNAVNCYNELISKLENNQKKSEIEIKNCQKIIKFFKE